jgi:uncharacterized protein YbjT (DUF2867 family)
MQNLLVLGGTGFIGRSVCAQLVQRSGGANGRIIVPTRRPNHGRRLQTLPTLEIVLADLHDDATLTRLVDGCDAVINLVAILQGNEAEFERVHVELPRRLAGACARTGVRRIVHVSALGADEEAPSRYLRSKARGEAVLATSGLDVTVLRPSIVFGEDDRFLNLFARLQSVLPVMPLAGADALFEPVWVEDVAAACRICLDDRTTIGEIIECSGPDRLTLRRLVQLAGRWSGHPRPIWPLPAPLATLQALFFEMLPGEALISRDNLASLTVPNIASGEWPGLARLGITPSALAAVVPRYLGPGEGLARLDTWRARARRT